MQPIRVLQLIDGLKVGGAEMLLRDLVDGLQREGYRVSVGYSTPGPLVPAVAALGTSMTQLPRMARIDPLLLLRMGRLIRRTRPQIVHTHLFKSDFHGRLAARMNRVPVVVSTLHNNDAWARTALLGRMYGATARLTDRLIAVSDEVRDFAITYTHVAPANVTTIVNGVPLQRFTGQDAAGQAVRQELGIPSDVPLLGVIGRLMPQKDHQTFLQAAARIALALPTARFLIVGDGALRTSLTTMVGDMDLGSRVIFCGIRSDIPAIMAALDLLVSSSRWEGLPVSLLEGMASARAVVATAVGGVPAVVVDDVTGVLVPPGDPDALARACVRLLNDPTARVQMGQAGRARVEANYSIETMVRRTVQLYETLLEQRGLRNDVAAQHALAGTPSE